MGVSTRSMRNCLLVLVVTLPLTGGIAQEQPNVNAEDGVAIKGYDSVAYFTDGRATAGKSEFEYRWDEVRWRFASATHRDEFAADPERYAPQYGGFCAGGMYFGETIAADPTVWKIVDGKLYLFSKPAFVDGWSKDAERRIQAASDNWSKFHPH